MNHTTALVNGANVTFLPTAAAMPVVNPQRRAAGRFPGNNVVSLAARKAKYEFRRRQQAYMARVEQAKQDDPKRNLRMCLKAAMEDREHADKVVQRISALLGAN